MDLFSIFIKDACKVNITVKDSVPVLRKISDIAAQTEQCSGIPADQIYRKLKEREDQGSTGFGNGIAIPHTRIAGMEDFLLFIVTVPRGVDFNAIDKKKVTMFFVLLGPEEKVNEHLQILASISHVLSSPTLKKEILSSKTAEAVSEAFLRHAHIAEKKKQPTQKMKALFVILYIEDFLYEILEFFIEKGLEGATIIESSGMGQYISNIPLFASFIGFMNEDKNRSQTIVVMVPDDQVNNIIEGIEEITGNLDKKQGAMVFTVDISFYKGSMKMM